PPDLVKRGAFVMAVDMFMKLGDIKGESADDKHKDEIDILSFSWGVTQTGTMAQGGGGGAGKASFHDFQFTHNLDAASPNLMKACATGEHVKSAIVTIRKAGKGQQEFLTYKLSDVIITGVNQHGHNGDGGIVEDVTLQSAKVEKEYKPQKADGSLGGGVK